VIDPEGRERVEDARGGPVADAARLGSEAAEGLLAAGAGRLLGR